jgi:uncharacterized protein
MAVCSVAAQTATSDPRFPGVTQDEVSELDIEISVLTKPERLMVPKAADLPGLIRPDIDGVTLSTGSYRAIFLPQVWKHVANPVEFLDLLCQKLGFPRRGWLVTPMDVEVYQVEEFSEGHLATAQSPGI